jgi:hypothetical protein
LVRILSKVEGGRDWGEGAAGSRVGARAGPERESGAGGAGVREEKREDGRGGTEEKPRKRERGQAGGVGEDKDKVFSKAPLGNQEIPLTNFCFDNLA